MVERGPRGRGPRAADRERRRDRSVGSAARYLFAEELDPLVGLNDAFSATLSRLRCLRSEAVPARESGTLTVMRSDLVAPLSIALTPPPLRSGQPGPAR